MIRHLFWWMALTFCLASCGEDEGIELAEIPFRIEFEIPAGLNTLEDHFFEITNVDNITEQVLEGRGVSIDQVNFMQPKVTRMSVLFDNTPLGFINECSVSLFHPTIGGLPSEAFWTPQIRFDQGSTLDIPGTLINAQRFLEKDRLNFEVRLDTREVNSQFITVRMDISFSARDK